MYYFAYGSCMNRKDFERTLRNEKFKVCGIAILNNYTLAYNAFSYTRKGGVLDVEESPGKQVFGILYKVPVTAIEKIDLREGNKYKRIKISVNFNNSYVDAVTYIIKEKQPTKANIEYSGIVYHAMIDNNFPSYYIEDYVKLVRISAYGSEEAYFRYKAQKRSIYG